MLLRERSINSKVSEEKGKSCYNFFLIILHSFKSRFLHILGGGEGRLEYYWRELRGKPMIQEIDFSYRSIYILTKSLQKLLLPHVFITNPVY